MRTISKINILLDSNIRNKFYKEVKFHNQLIEELQRFGIKKNFQLLNYNSTFSVYEEAGLGKLVNLDIAVIEEDINNLKTTRLGSEEEAKLLFDMAEDYLKQTLEKIKEIEQYKRDYILKKLEGKLPFIDHESVKQRFINDFIDGHDDDDHEVLYGNIAFEYLQDKFLQSKIDPDRRARFLLSQFYHFLSDYRSNSLFRSAHQVWVESFSVEFVKKNPELSPFIRNIETKFKITSREDFVDNELIHFSVMGNRRRGEKIKFLVVTNDPIENILCRISLYKFTILNTIEMAKSFPRPVSIPEMNQGYIGTFKDGKLRWLSVAAIPPIGELKDLSVISELSKNLIP